MDNRIGHYDSEALPENQDPILQLVERTNNLEEAKSQIDSQVNKLFTFDYNAIDGIFTSTDSQIQIEMTKIKENALKSGMPIPRNFPSKRLEDLCKHYPSGIPENLRVSLTKDLTNIITNQISQIGLVTQEFKQDLEVILTEVLTSTDFEDWNFAKEDALVRKLNKEIDNNEIKSKVKQQLLANKGGDGIEKIEVLEAKALEKASFLRNKFNTIINEDLYSKLTREDQTIAFNTIYTLDAMGISLDEVGEQITSFFEVYSHFRSTLELEERLNSSLDKLPKEIKDTLIIGLFEQEKHLGDWISNLDTEITLYDLKQLTRYDQYSDQYNLQELVVKMHTKYIKSYNFGDEDLNDYVQEGGNWQDDISTFTVLTLYFNSLLEKYHTLENHNILVEFEEAIKFSILYRKFKFSDETWKYSFEGIKDYRKYWAPSISLNGELPVEYLIDYIGKNPVEQVKSTSDNIIKGAESVKQAIDSSTKNEYEYWQAIREGNMVRQCDSIFQKNLPHYEFFRSLQGIDLESLDTQMQDFFYDIKTTLGDKEPDQYNTKTPVINWLTKKLEEEFGETAGTDEGRTNILKYILNVRIIETKEGLYETGETPYEKVKKDWSGSDEKQRYALAEKINEAVYGLTFSDYVSKNINTKGYRETSYLKSIINDRHLKPSSEGSGHRSAAGYYPHQSETMESFTAVLGLYSSINRAKENFDNLRKAFAFLDSGEVDLDKILSFTSINAPFLIKNEDSAEVKLFIETYRRYRQFNLTEEKRNYLNKLWSSPFLSYMSKGLFIHEDGSEIEGMGILPGILLSYPVDVYNSYSQIGPGQEFYVRHKAAISFLDDSVQNGHLTQEERDQCLKTYNSMVEIFVQSEES